MSFRLWSLGQVKVVVFGMRDDCGYSNGLAVFSVQTFLDVAVIIFLKRDVFVLNGFFVNRQFFEDIIFDGRID